MQLLCVICVSSFNSRTLGRVRPSLSERMMRASAFQFTHPGKGATGEDGRFYSLVWFQFTHPGKGATSGRFGRSSNAYCFNSRTLGRVRQALRPPLVWGRAVSIHAPWEGCDGVRGSVCLLVGLFQFTHPGKGATYGGDKSKLNWGGFNSRTLGRVRLVARYVFDYVPLFQFTHPGKGATHRRYLVFRKSVFQFTHPGKGATQRRSI